MEPVAVVALVVVVVVVIALAGWIISTRNRLLRSRNRSTEALKGIDIALSTRYDQVKSQADAAAGAVSKEVELVLGNTGLRTGRKVSDLSVAEKSDLHRALQDAERSLLGAGGVSVSVEANPELTTRHNIELLQRTINETEERLQAARRVYNSAATDYNTRRQLFPTVLIAGMLGFSDHQLFELSDPGKREPTDLSGFLQ